MKPIALVAIGVAAAVAGFAIYRFGIEPRVAPAEKASHELVDEFPGTPAGTVSPAGVPAPSGQSASDEADVPAKLPDFTLVDIEGTQRSILGWPGKSMIVNFWATWCAPCRREIPLLRELQHQHGAEGFQVVGVAVDFRDDVVKYAQEIGIDYPVLIGEQDGLDAVNKFGRGSLGFPFTVFTDNRQRIVLFHLGEIKKAQAEVLLDTVRKVNRGELTPEAARVVAAKQLASLDSPEA
jgi:thiol-disulfide isomerase/thioredoxin